MQSQHFLKQPKKRKKREISQREWKKKGETQVVGRGGQTTLGIVKKKNKKQAVEAGACG